MTLAEKLNQIIQQQGVSKAEFARRVGITANYLYILTGESHSETQRNRKLSPSLAKLIALEFGYDENWLMREEND